MSMAQIKKNVCFFNGLRAALSPTFQSVIPPASVENFENIGHMMLSPDKGNVFNEWISALLNRIGQQYIRQPKARNKLSMFWRDSMVWGDIIEEIGIDLPMAKRYLEGQQDGDEDNNYQGSFDKIPDCYPDPFCKEKQEAVTHFHRRNREDFYKRTIWRHTLMKAFTGQTGFGTLVEAMINVMYTANRRDQYLYCKELLSQYVNNPVMPLAANQVVTLNTPLTDDASAKEYIRVIKNKVELMSFNSINFNPVGQTTYNDPGELVMLVKAGVNGIVDVETMAGAFSPGYLAKGVDDVIVVDDFGTNTWTGLTPDDPGYDTTPGTGVLAMIFDRRFINVTPNSQEFASLYNPEGRYWNYWLHVWETYWLSYFMNVIIIKQ